jgi:hypothetical protein
VLLLLLLLLVIVGGNVGAMAAAAVKKISNLFYQLLVGQKYGFTVHQRKYGLKQVSNKELSAFSRGQ